MRKTYRVHLRSGTTIKFKADDFILKWEGRDITSWEAPNANRWLFFLPAELVGVERVK